MSFLQTINALFIKLDEYLRWYMEFNTAKCDSYYC